ncbi:MAG: T9SS type A sorting domain-containing protein [Bacteroidales bacterium]|nr:T9SS type A sorting domain-containing protein [Bacteroidales bacterium]
MKNSALLLFAFALLFGVKAFAQEPSPADIQSNPFIAAEMQESVPLQHPAIVSEEAVWLHYGTEEYYTSIAYRPEGIPFSWAVMFPPSILQSYEGFTLTRVAFYESEWNTGNLMMQVYYGNSYMPLTLMNEQLYTPIHYVGLVDFDLEHPVAIDITQYLWIVFSELMVTETYSASVSYAAPSEADPNARWVQTAENKWEDAANYGFDMVQFMIWGHVTNDPWGLESQLISSDLIVYPNPVNDVVRIDGVTATEVLVYNALGQLTKTVCDMNEFSVADLPEGVYLLRIRDEKGNVYTDKIIIQ